MSERNKESSVLTGSLVIPLIGTVTNSRQLSSKNTKTNVSNNTSQAMSETTASSSSGDDKQSVAERLRLQGNDAFQSQDMTKAIELYQESNQHKEQATTYSNLAATYYRLNKPSDAIDAAKRSIELDPNWGKGWWRFGVIHESVFQLEQAEFCYQKATELDPNELLFKRALTDVQRKLKTVRKQQQPPRQQQQQQQQQKMPTTNSETYITQHPAQKASLRPPTDQQRQPQRRKMILRNPGYKAWMEAVTVVGRGSSFNVLGRYAALQGTTMAPTSRQWLVFGFCDWVNGMKRAIAQFAKSVSKEADAACQSLIQQKPKFKTEEGFLMAFEEIIGGFPDGKSILSLASGLACLGGNFIFLETSDVSTPGSQGTREQNDAAARQETPTLLSPPGRFLQHVSHYQHMSILWSIDSVLGELLQRHNFDGSAIKCSKAVMQASITLWSNLPSAMRFRHTSIPNPDKHDPTPKEVVRYMKDQVRTGKQTWEKSGTEKHSGMHKFCSLQYRGTMLYAALIRDSGGAAVSYQYMKWAREFISLADQEFGVSMSTPPTYNEMTMVFQPNLRVGMMIAELITLNALRGNQIFGPYSMEMSLNLCQEIVQMAKRVDVSDQPNKYLLIQWDVAARRKPLSIAHATIAHHLNILQSTYDIGHFQQIVSHHGMHVEGVFDGKSCDDPFALIAHHYRTAAENELADSDQGAMYWWAYGSCIAQAKSSSGFTLDQLQTAVEKAKAADEARDVDLFGKNDQLGGTFEAIARLTMEYCQGKDRPSSFVLPQVKVVRDQGEPHFVKIVKDDSIGSDPRDDIIICSDFSKYQRKEGEFYADKEGQQEVTEKTRNGTPSEPSSAATTEPVPPNVVEDKVEFSTVEDLTDVLNSFATSLN